MAFIYLVVFIILIIFILCFLVSAVQFCIDIRHCSELRNELKEAINRVKKQNIDLFNCDISNEEEQIQATEGDENV